jgi:hypothetical protein
MFSSSPSFLSRLLGHHAEIIPQMCNLRCSSVKDVAAGTVFFVIGLLERPAFASLVGALATPTLLGISCFRALPVRC